MSSAAKQSIQDAAAMLKESPILIVGAGRVGQALCAEIAAAGLPLVGLWNRSHIDPPSISDTVEFASGSDMPPLAWQQQAGLVLLTVSDDAIAGVADSLSLQTNATVMHSSGALSSDELRGLADNTSLGSYHPLQSFSNDQGSTIEVPPYVVAVEGDEGALALGHALAGVTGHRSVELSREQKAGYHAAAVLASNCLVALESAATRVMGRATGDAAGAWDLLWPLVMGTLAGLESGGPTQAITGPMARGDVRSIERNLAALSTDPHARDLYRVLGAEAVEVALDAGLSEERAKWVREAINKV